MNINLLKKSIFVTVLGTAFTSFAGEKLPLTDLQRFTTVVDHIRNYYVNPTEDATLFENAIRGMLSGLDPHSSYLDIDEYSDLKINTSGKFGGLGIEVTLEDGFIRVISPIDETPAAKAGINAGDLIIRINDTPIKGLSLKEAVDMMRGKPGTDIALSIIRTGEPKPLVVKVTRDIINVHSVRSQMLEDNYAYVRISQFQNDTGDELVKEIKQLKKHNKQLQGMILDLRNNPGGVLEASVQIAGAFLNPEELKYDGVIVFTKGRISGSQITEKARSKDLLSNAPMVILVNSGSASASEIVAGALQDHKRALILGTKTFGKGSVQTILPLKEKRGLKLTTALYYTPSGRSIQATGITPDIHIDNVSIPTPKETESDALLIKEADLQRHLESNDKQKTADKSSKNQKSANQLMYSDYQLYQALNVLKGLHVFNKHSA